MAQTRPLSISSLDISMVTLRTKSHEVIKALKKGRRLRLTYRGKVIATLEPILESRDSTNKDDPLLRISELAVPSPEGALDHNEIDSLIYD